MRPQGTRRGLSRSIQQFAQGRFQVGELEFVAELHGATRHDALSRHREGGCLAEENSQRQARHRQPARPAQYVGQGLGEPPVGLRLRRRGVDRPAEFRPVQPEEEQADHVRGVDPARPTACRCRWCLPGTSERARASFSRRRRADREPCRFECCRPERRHLWPAGRRLPSRHRSVPENRVRADSPRRIPRSGRARSNPLPRRKARPLPLRLPDAVAGPAPRQSTGCFRSVSRRGAF